MSETAVIFGCSGTKLSADERAFFQDTDPWGYILFKRNCSAPDQIRALTDSFRDLAGRDNLPILIDQEGGRVARLQSTAWYQAPPAARFGEILADDLARAEEAVRLNSRLIAHDLTELGITVDCLPVLDVPVEDSHIVIGDRAYGTDPDMVAALGRAAALGLLDLGILPVIKHIPGHGRARSDTHLHLPHVETGRGELEITDFAPFAALNDLPLAMTAHVVYDAIDPYRPATLSVTVIEQVIRGHIGFDGLLMTDDLSMEALSGSLEDRAADSLEAGCDVVLHCNGVMNEMKSVARGVSDLSDRARERADAALLPVGRVRDAFDSEEALSRLASLLT